MISAIATVVASAISTSSIDTFDTDNEAWCVGGAGVNPTFKDVISFNDQPCSLSHFSDGSGPNGKWLIWSQQSDWIGDYVATGVGIRTKKIITN